MNSIIENSLKRSMTYLEYRELVKHLAQQNTGTGHVKTEELVNYIVLNNSRMKRWDKTLKVPQEVEKKLKSINQDFLWLVIAESWCGDAAHVLPVLNKLAELNNHIDLKVVLRDQNPELMNAFLTNGTRSIPKLIMIDKKTDKVIHGFGPRPSEATAFINRFKSKYGDLTPEFKEDLQHWYNTNKGLNIMEDIVKALG
jgi:thiol-disulfide isomerase/thioredoxin